MTLRRDQGRSDCRRLSFELIEPQEPARLTFTPKRYNDFSFSFHLTNISLMVDTEGTSSFEYLRTLFRGIVATAFWTYRLLSLHSPIMEVFSVNSVY